MKKFLSLLSILSCFYSYSMVDNCSYSKVDKKLEKQSPIFANAKSDTAFKHMMADNKAAISLLNATIPDFQVEGNRVTELTPAPTTVPAFKPAKTAKTTKAAKTTSDNPVIMDYHAITQRGEHVAIEMQLKRHLMFDERALYYGAYVYSHQLAENNLENAEWYENIKKTYCVQFLDYSSDNAIGMVDKASRTSKATLDKDIEKKGEKNRKKKQELKPKRVISSKDSLIHRVRNNPMQQDQYMKHFMMTDERSGQKIDALQMIQYELPRAYEILKLRNKTLTKENGIEEWWMKVLENTESISEKEMKNAPIGVSAALKRLTIGEWNPDLRAAYNKDMEDAKQEKELNFKKAKWLEAGRKEGLEEGRKEASIRIVENMMQLGFDDQTIVDCSGLELKEVELLRGEISKK